MLCSRQCFNFNLRLEKWLIETFSFWGDHWSLSCRIPVCLFSGCYDIVPDVVIPVRAGVYQTVLLKRHVSHLFGFLSFIAGLLLEDSYAQGYAYALVQETIQTRRNVGLRMEKNVFVSFFALAFTIVAHVLALDLRLCTHICYQNQALSCFKMNSFPYMGLVFQGGIRS